MPPKHSWLWKIYLVFMIIVAAQRLHNLFTSESTSFLYYFILRAFNPAYTWVYSAHVLSAVLTAIHCIPLYLFIQGKRSLNPELWRYLFILRGVFELVGHSYEMNTITAVYHTNPELLLLVAAAAIIPQIPSYVACYLYAFKYNSK